MTSLIWPKIALWSGCFAWSLFCWWMIGLAAVKLFEFCKECL